MTRNGVRCAFCAAPATPYWEAAAVWRCEGCALLFRHPMPTEQDLDGLYAISWLSPREHARATGGTDANLARLYARKLARALGRADFQGLRILDFGAGKGEMLTALSELGAVVCGVDPYGYDYLRSQGFKAFPTLDDLPENARFDGAVTIDVIEHVPDPWAYLRQIRSRLSHPGWLYVATPNPTGLGALLYKSQWREVRNPTHLVFLPPGNLEAVLARCGFPRQRRLRWSIGYGTGVPRRLLHYALQGLALDGELRYLAWTGGPTL